MSPSTEAVVAITSSAMMSGTRSGTGTGTGTGPVAPAAAAAAAAVITSTPLGSTGRKTSSRMDTATTA
ncbi:hypothetical protein GCM10020254_57680 [Streptomyces goshikiensis]